MSIRMFDTYTTSNAEAEHSALKCASVGVSANDTMTALAQKANLQATRRTNQRVVDQTKDLQCTDTKSKCPLSTMITKKCFAAVCQYIELAKLCISKQTSNKSWTVCYLRPTSISTKLHLHYLPILRRKRVLSIESGTVKLHFIMILTKSSGIVLMHFVICFEDMLMCSCRTFQRYGYPCHHMFHVMNIYKTGDVRKEWIHIRWYKYYTAQYLSPDSTSEQNEIYSKLINMHPKGPMFYPPVYDTYPYYKGYNDSIVTERMFPHSNLVLLCRSTNLCWIRSNDTTDEAIKQLIQSNNAELVSVDIELSQEQKNIHHSQTEFECDNSFDLEETDNMIPEVPLYTKDHYIFSDKLAMFRRASDLCGDDVEKHKELYEMLHEFVSKNEMDNCDNDKVLAKRKGGTDGTTTMISSNKVINKRCRSTKRKRAFHER